MATPMGPTPVTKERPAGITILAVLMFISGIMWMIVGVVSGYYTAMLPGGAGAGLTGYATICTIVLVIVGLVYFLIGWGLWTLKGWARTIAIILAILSLCNIPVGTIIGIIILWYLFKPEIKAAFE
ncbi:MAG: hypothetical protein QMC80_07250 [Thermoplasmatales archaeon]|nr:hypothetical protein [Thermoplasmatales archaeon]